MKIALLLIVLAVGERLLFDLGPNIELVTMAAILAGMYLPWRWRLGVPLGIMAISDSILGIGSISLFTWSGFAAMSFLPFFWKRWTNNRMEKGLASGFSGSCLFYLWTNLGVWLTDSWGMYSRDGAGLWQCYVNAIPFYKNSLLSTAVFVPLGIILMELWLFRKSKFRARTVSFVTNLVG